MTLFIKSRQHYSEPLKMRASKGALRGYFQERLAGSAGFGDVAGIEFVDDPTPTAAGGYFDSNRLLAGEDLAHLAIRWSLNSPPRSLRQLPGGIARCLGILKRRLRASCRERHKGPSPIAAVWCAPAGRLISCIRLLLKHQRQHLEQGSFQAAAATTEKKHCSQETLRNTTIVLNSSYSIFPTWQEQ